jgi:hypothetical protein
MDGGAFATITAVIARLDRATQYSRGVSDGIEKPRRTGSPVKPGRQSGGNRRSVRG